MNKPFSCASINIDCADTINNIAFDGHAYYCTIACKREIVMLDECYQIQKTFCTNIEYDCISYDWCDNCFWASSKTCYNKLFKLDCNMKEIDCISLSGLPFSRNVTGISVNCCDDTLIVSFACAIIQVKKQCGTSKVLYWCKNGWILSVLSLCPCALSIVQRDDKYYVEVFDSCWDVIKSHCVKDQVSLKTLMFNPCKCITNLFRFDVFLLKKYSHPYICNYNICPEDLGFTPHSCNYKLCDNPCNGAVCDHSNSCTDSCADIIESIALIETALSHILNAEGEKLQKVIAETDDFEKILCVNREVNQTIVNITHLEHVLYSKLSALQECEICNNPCNSCNACSHCDNHFIYNDDKHKF